MLIEREYSRRLDAHKYVLHKLRIQFMMFSYILKLILNLKSNEAEEFL